MKRKLKMTSKTVSETKESPVQELLGPVTIADQVQKLKDFSIISISIAATGENPLKDKITSIAIAAPDRNPLLIDLTQYRLEEIGIFLKELLGSPSEKVFYDGKRVINFFRGLDMTVNGPIYDVMLANKILNAGRGAMKRTFNEIARDYLKTRAGIELTLSSIADVAVSLLKLREVMIPVLKEDSLMDTANLEFDCVRAVAGMEMNGIRINDKKLRETLQELTKQKEFFTEDLHKELGNINLNSHKQVKEALNKRGIMVNDIKQDTLFPYFMPHVWL